MEICNFCDRSPNAEKRTDNKKRKDSNSREEKEREKKGFGEVIQRARVHILKLVNPPPLSLVRLGGRARFGVSGWGTIASDAVICATAPRDQKTSHR